METASATSANQQPLNRHERLANEAQERRQESPAAYTILGFCAEFGVSKSYTYNLIRANELDARKVGTKTIITGDSARRWFAALPKAEIRAAKEAS